LSQVCIQKADYKDLNIDSLLTPLGGMESFISRGDNVLLKINLLSAREPTRAVTTHPQVVRVVAQAVRQAGGVPYIADSPSGTFSQKALRRAYDISGITDIAEKEGITLNFNTRSRKMNFPQAQKLKTIPICDFIQEADKIIALPKLKTHSFQYMTLACKIMYGAIPGLTKAGYHARFPGRSAFADFLLDILTQVKPHLYIMDGILGMQGQGPASGDPVELGLLLASTDPIAMDMAVCHILGIEPVGIPVLKRANIRKWWPDTIDYPILKPDDVSFKGFILPNTADHLITGKKHPQKRPVITEKCVGCGECETICPKGAITLAGDTVQVMTAQVNHSKCIRCYCCHEVCPEDAILLSVLK